MNKIAIYILVILFLSPFIGTEAFSQTPTVKKQFLTKPFQNKVFIKEQGQFSRNAKEFKVPFDELVLYGVENLEFNAYFTIHGIIFQFPERKKIKKRNWRKEKQETGKEKDDDERDVETQWHSSQMLWLNTNPLTKLVPEQKVSEYYNYEGFGKKSNVNFVPAYKKIKYTNLYPGVDAEFELSEEGGLKYKFIVQPNVVIPEIAFKWKGVNAIDIDENGNLQINNTFGSKAINEPLQLLDHAPTAFTSSSHTAIPVKYKVINNVVQFDFSSQKISSSEGIVIDPWITVTNFSSVNKAFDIQEDSLGNVFIIGNNTNWEIQKFNPAGVLQWTYVSYAILMGDIAVDNPGNVYIVGGYSGGKRQKLDTAGVQLWVFSGLAEEWRLSFNYSKTILSEGGYFNVSPGDNLAKLDINTGAISNQMVYGAETRGLATDCNGDIYSLHVTFGYSGVAASNVLRKTNSNFTPAGSVLSGFLLSEAQGAGTAYGLNPAYSPSIYQVLNAVVINGPYVFIYDGATIRRINKTALTVINSTSVPNGVVTMCGGIAADLCGDIYAGTTNGIAKFDSSLTYISTITTPDAVYDLILANNGDILACGKGFVGSFSTGCVAPPALTATATSTPANCGFGGTATAVAIGGSPPYSYSWMPGGQTTAVDTGLTQGIYTCTVSDPFCHSYIVTVAVNQIPTLIANTALGGYLCPGMCDTIGGAPSASGGVPPYTYLWSPATGLNSTTVANPIACPLMSTSYTLVVTDSTGCTASDSDATVTVYPSPTANFSLADVCLHQPVSFYDSTTFVWGVDTVLNWSWNYGDGTALGTLNNPSHIYLNTGTNSVTLITTSNNGCKDTVVKTVVIHPLPSAQFSRTNVCDGTSIQFNDLSTISSPDAIQTWNWSFGDNNTGTIPSPSHLYATNGSYSVMLITVSNFGCRDSVIKISVVNPNPVVKFAAPDTVGCEPLCVTFQNTSTIATGNNTHFVWNLGDGSPLNNLPIDLLHCYKNDSLFAPIRYSLTLTVTSDSGCVSTKIKNNYITVYPNPNAVFSVLPSTATVTDPVVSFTNLSTGATGWSWNLGDNTLLAIEHPADHTYPDTGTYLVTLITSTQYNCFDTAQQTIIIEPDFMFYIPNAFTPDGDGTNDSFTGKGVFIKEFEMTIYDRWGNNIYYTDDIKKPWDGRANKGPEIAQRDVYVFVVKVIDFKLRKHDYRGIVTLVR